jgi:hypothetical protein
VLVFLDRTLSRSHGHTFPTRQKPQRPLTVPPRRSLSHLHDLPLSPRFRRNPPTRNPIRPRFSNSPLSQTYQKLVSSSPIQKSQAGMSTHSLESY